MSYRISVPSDAENIIAVVKTIVITATLVLTFGQYAELNEDCKNDTDHVDILAPPLIAGVMLSVALLGRLVYLLLSCCNQNEKTGGNLTLSLANIAYTGGFIALAMATIQAKMYGNLDSTGDLKDVDVPPTAMQTCVQNAASENDDKFLSVNYFAWGLTHLILLAVCDVSLFITRTLKRDGFKYEHVEQQYVGSGRA